ncbi:MAG: conjugal transfer protein TraR [Ignavibacteriaceae bacterium]|nr:conjugal transfer protein TraR [Ignavibacteriaceae bacterium]
MTSKAKPKKADEKKKKATLKPVVKTSVKKTAAKVEKVKKTDVKVKKTVKASAPKAAPKKTATVKTSPEKITKKKTAVKETTKKIAKKKDVIKEVKDLVTKETKKVDAVPKKKEKKSEQQPEQKQLSTAEIRAAALKKIKGYSKEELEHFKKIILEKRDEIVEQLQNLREQMLDPTTGEYINENSPYSLHMAEQGTDAMEREKTFLYAQRENKFLGYLEDALKRIETGTYGICVDCIEEPQHLCPTCPLVPKERLEAVPHSQLCVAIKQKQEKR